MRVGAPSQHFLKVTRGRFDNLMRRIGEEVLDLLFLRSAERRRNESLVNGRDYATPHDVKGVAPVRIRGNTARYSYKLYLDAENRDNLVGLRDKMVLLPDGTVRNTATVFKGIFPVGRVVVNFARARDAHKLKRP